jgi:hypothetical protein
MKLADILSQYKPLYPEAHNWEATSAYMMESPVDKDIIVELVVALQTEGAFREPILLQPSSQYVLDGTHRIIAHMVAQNNEVPVSYDDQENEEAVESALLTTTIVFSEDLTGEMFNSLFSTLRSIYISPELWLVSHVSSLRARTLHLLWDTTEANSIPLAKLQATIEGLLEKHQIAQPTSITTVLEESGD